MVPSTPCRRLVSSLRTVLAALLIMSSAATGLQAGPRTDEEQQRALLDLVVNEVPKGQVLALVRGKDVLLPVAVLERSGLQDLGGRRESIDNQAWVSLASLAPGITFVLDERALTVKVTAAERFLAGRSRVDLRSGERPAFERSRATSGFLNYGVNWGKALGYQFTGEAGLSARGALANSTFFWNRDHSLIRGLTSVTLDSPGSLRRIVVGDSYVSDRLLGGSVFLAGVRVATDYGVDPYFLRYPALGLSGAVATPSTVEVFVDNRLVRRQELEPGQFELANLPVPVGSSQTRLVIRDAFGREQQTTSGIYLASQVLGRGLQEYEYAVGSPRQSVSASSWNYSGVAALARHRYGVTDTVTAGFRAELSSSMFNGGPSFNLRLPFGEIEAAAAGSRVGGRDGMAASLAYSYTSKSFSTGFTGRAWSVDYRTLSSSESGQRPLREGNAFVAFAVGPRVNATLQHALTTGQYGQSRSRTALFGAGRLSARSSLFFSVARNASPHRVRGEFSLGLSIALADRSSASASVTTRDDGATGMSAEIQRALPVGAGYGYRLQGSAGSPDTSETRFAYQTAFGHYQFARESLGGPPTVTLNASGGLALIGGRMYATRPVDQGFALVRVPGVKGVRGYLSNQLVGRTNARGDLLIPNLLPYYANRLSVSDLDIPLDRAVARTEYTVAPPYRGGALVVFPATQVRSITGRVELEVNGRLWKPEFGDLSVEVEGGRHLESPIGHEGEYYLENLAPGKYKALVRYRGTVCGFSLKVPASNNVVVDVGLSHCVAKNP